MSIEYNKTILSKVRDKISGGVNRLLVTLAFAGCVNAMSAKTVVGTYIKGNMKGSMVELNAEDGKFRVKSNALCLAITEESNKPGGEVQVAVTFDETTSEVRGAFISHSPIRIGSGISNMLWDITNVKDRTNEAIGNARDINFLRFLGNIKSATDDYAPSEIQCDGILQVPARGSNGEVKWAKYHTVNKGRLKPEYDPFLTSNTGTNNAKYSPPSSTGSQTTYQSTGTGSQTPNMRQVQSNYYKR